MKSRLVLWLFILLANTLYAQQANIPLNITESPSGKPLDSVKIYDKIAHTIFYTNAQGKAAVIMQLNGKMNLELSKEGYETIIIKKDSSSAKRINVAMQLINYALPPIEINPEIAPHTFFGKKNCIVLDYILSDAYTYVALQAYKTNHFYMVLLNGQNQIIDTMSFSSDFEEFYLSGLGLIYAITKNEELAISVRKGYISTEVVNTKFFETKIKYYLGGYHNYYYIGFPSISRQTKYFVLEDYEKKIIYKNQPFYRVRDESRERQAQKEYDSLQQIRSRELSQIIPDYDTKFDELEGHDGDVSFIKRQEFIQQYVNHPVYAPFFQYENQFVIFDFQKDKYIEFDSSAVITKEITIDFHKSKNWGKMVLNHTTDKNIYYTLYLNNDKYVSLHQINMKDQSNTVVKNLAYKKIDHIKYFNNYIYYLHQPDDNNPDIFLYREKAK